MGQPTLSVVTQPLAETLALSGSATIDNTQNIYLKFWDHSHVSGLSSTFTLDDGQSLAGTGSITGDITFASTNSTGANFQDGSKIKPGDTATNYGIGKIEVTGAGTWNAGTTYQWEINDLTGDAGDANGDGKGWDYLTFSGALTIAGDTNNKILLDIAALDGYNSPYNLARRIQVGIQRSPQSTDTLKMDMNSKLFMQKAVLQDLTQIISKLSTPILPAMG